MKSFHKILSLLVIAAAFALLPRAGVLSVSAREPVNYYFKYNIEAEDWYFQRDKWDDSYIGWGSNFLNYDAYKPVDGDVVAILPCSEDYIPSKKLVINAHLSNLTVVGAGGVIEVSKMDECYVLANSYVSINGDVTNAYLYGKTTCSFTNNVETLTLNNPKAERNEASISVGGTVGHVLELVADSTNRDFYNVAAGKLFYNANGVLCTSSEFYSQTAPANVPAKNPSVSAASPSSDVYIVQRGDTLSKIAKKNGLTLKEIVALNPQIKNINLIWAGQKINLK